MEKPTLVPAFIEGRTKEDLMLKMLKNNLGHGCHFKYFSIVKDGKKWVAWYFKDLSRAITQKGLKDVTPRM